MIERTRELVQRVIGTNDATFNRQLLSAEKDRLKNREREHEAGRLSYVRPAASLEAMKADFLAYVGHLESSKQGKSTYAWETLSSIFHRIDSFAPGSEQRADAELLLLSALDGARTAYHVYEKQYVPGKDYTCPKGLEERLLDGHFFLTPIGTLSVSPLSHFLDRLLTPFITYDADMKGEGNPPACSELLYALYFEAAGYSTKQEVVERYCFKGQEKKDIVARLRRLSQGDFLIEQKTDSVAILRQQYLATLNPSKEKTTETEEQRQQREKKDQEKQRGFNAVIGLLPEASCEELDNQYGEIMTFLKSKDVIEKQKITEEKVVLLSEPREHETIVRAMLESGHFLDDNHLHTVLAIIGDNDFKTMQELVNLGKMPEEVENSAPGAREELQRLHGAYLSSGLGVFCHFYDEPTINQRLTNDQMHHSLSIAEPSLCLWLSDHRGFLSLAQKERLAVLCAKAGYARAIRILCSKTPGGDVSPNYVDPQERRSLLEIASCQDHTDTACALIEHGANVNLKDDDGNTALMRASKSGHTDTARALIEHGAKVNLQEWGWGGWTALMLASASQHTATARVLIAAGADINLQKNRKINALMLASTYGNTDTARALINAGADLNLKDDDGNTALMRASKYGHTEIVELLQSALSKQPIEGPGSLMAARATAEHHFITLASNHIAGDIDWNNLNLNRFLVDGRNALEIALSHHNIPLVQTILAQESLAPWVMLKALKEHFNVMLPLVGQHERLRRLVRLHKKTFSTEAQHAIANCLERNDLSGEISAGSSLTFSSSNTSGNTQENPLLRFLRAFF